MRLVWGHCAFKAFSDAWRRLKGFEHVLGRHGGGDIKPLIPAAVKENKNDASRACRQ